MHLELYQIQPFSILIKIRVYKKKKKKCSFP